MVTYQLENITDLLISELTPILDIHRKELQTYSDMNLNPDWDMYRSVERRNNLVLLVARDEDDMIVGYAAFLLNLNPHYKDFLYAIEDVFYVVQDNRGSRIAVNMIKKSEKILKAKGVDTIVHHAKFTNTFAPFLEKLGYKQTEVMLAKRLTDEA